MQKELRTLIVFSEHTFYRLVVTQLTIRRYSPLIPRPEAAYVVPCPKAVSDLLVWKHCSQNGGGRCGGGSEDLF